MNYGAGENKEEIKCSDGVKMMERDKRA